MDQDLTDTASPGDDSDRDALAGPERRIYSDGHRALLATCAAATVPFALGWLISEVRPRYDGLALTVTMLLLGWNVFAVVYVVLTARTFDRVDRDQFRAQMAVRDARRSAFWRLVNPRGDGPAYAVWSAVVAFVVVLVLPHIQGISIDEWLLVPVSLSILLSCWALAIVSYSLHYAQHDLDAPGLSFPGDRTGAYADYLYFSIAVATTFGATDVNIVTPKMRKVVNFHTVLTFIYNSVIVALLASLLIR